MATNAASNDELRELYADESARLRQEFSATPDGRSAVFGRTALVESLALRLWKQMISPEPEGPRNFALVALGGFGRRWLFPYSDVDILFLHAGDGGEAKLKSGIRNFSQEMWDLRLKLSPATRTLAECEKFDPNNVEFTISLLDCRYLAGDKSLFNRLHDQLIPKLVARESRSIVHRLTDLTHSRYNKFGNTVFHLEPNVKDGPGGLRDYNLAHWLALIAAMEEQGAWPDEATLLPSWLRERFDAALNFQMSVRCFLLFRHGRNDNTLAWLAQDQAAAEKVGAPGAETLTAADWMRIYFGHARLIHRVGLQLLEEFPAARPSLYRQFQNLRSRLSNAEFAIVDGRIFLQRQEPPSDSELPLRMFRFMARHGLSLSSSAEHQIEELQPALAAAPPKGAQLWHYLQEILVAPHAAEALRAMHSLRLLTPLLPEFQAIDSLVIRDYSHRFTVDEHTFVAIENLHALKKSQSKWDQGYSELLDELEQPDLLYLALLLHDTGKGTKPGNHIVGGLEIAEVSLARLDLDPPDRETVLFLIANHLVMGSALRRDIFDPEAIRQIAEKMGTPERLKMLCLLTYADIKAVNPEALTPWKAENLWQLYIGTANYLLRNVDQRLHVAPDEDTLAHLRSLAPAAGRKLEGFLEGLPKRYLRTHAVEDVLAHMNMANALAKDPVQVALKRGRHWFDLSVVTSDRAFLFANMTGVLAAWGMNIVKATAFSNHAGVVVDTFYFTDQFRVLELNLPEWERFKQSVPNVVTGKPDWQRMLRYRVHSQKVAIPKVKVTTAIDFDDACSQHSTLIEVVTQDHPGLLHRISSKFSEHNCSIDIALIETEGQPAIDVFYLTPAGAKLPTEQQARVRAALLSELAAR